MFDVQYLGAKMNGKTCKNDNHSRRTSSKPFACLPFTIMSIYIFLCMICFLFVMKRSNKGTKENKTNSGMVCAIVRDM